MGEGERWRRDRPRGSAWPPALRWPAGVPVAGGGPISAELLWAAYRVAGPDMRAVARVYNGLVRRLRGAAAAGGVMEGGRGKSRLG